MIISLVQSSVFHFMAPCLDFFQSSAIYHYFGFPLFDSSTTPSSPTYTMMIKISMILLAFAPAALGADALTQCPQVDCFVDPCYNKCEEGQKCLTTPSYFEHEGQKCKGCPVFDQCVDEPLPCPQVLCQNPCEGQCKKGETCITKPTYFEFDGQKCKGCPVFDSCVDQPKLPCPLIRCIDPCSADPDPCKDPLGCETVPSFMVLHGQKCPGCPTHKCVRPKKNLLRA